MRNFCQIGKSFCIESVKYPWHGFLQVSMLKERYKYNSSLSKRKSCHRMINHRSRSLRIVQKKHFQFHHGGKIEKDIKFSYLSKISIYLDNPFFLYINAFLMLKTKACFGFCHQLFLKTLKSQREEKQKKHDLVTIFFIFKFLKFSEV